MRRQTLILSVIHGPGWGAESVLEQYLYSKPEEICICAPPSSRIGELSKSLGLPFYPWNANKDSAKENLQMALKLQVSQEVDRIHGWCLRSIESAWLLAFRHQCPWSFGLHDSPLQPYHSWLRRKLIFTGAHSAKALVTVSEVMKEHCMEIGLAKIPEVIPNGIRDLKEPKPCKSLNTDPPVIGFLGMNTPHKGFSLVRKWIQATECQWRLYGELHPELSDEFKELLAVCGERVIYCGRRDNERLYNELDLVVMPSLSFESFGLVAVEAFRAGLPVVASRYGGLQEVIADTQTGYLFQKGNVEEGLKYLNILISNPDLRREMGNKARKRYETTYRAAQMSKQLSAFLKEGTSC